MRQASDQPKVCNMALPLISNSHKVGPTKERSSNTKIVRAGPTFREQRPYAVAAEIRRYTILNRPPQNRSSSQILKSGSIHWV